MANQIVKQQSRQRYNDKMDKIKNNDYLQKYGEKALEVYKKTLRNTQDELEGPEHSHLPPKGSSRNKSGSMKSLHKSSKSKSKLTIPPSEITFTFNKPHHDRNQKKLVISGLSTPKNKPSRLTVAQNERPRSSSTKKKVAQVKIAEKIQDALHKSKSIKSMIRAVLQCLDLMVQEEDKICKWMSQLKEVFCHVSNEALLYRKKLKEEAAKNKRLSKQIEQLQSSLKSNLDRKRKPVEVVIIEENQKLRNQIDRLQEKVSNFERKQMVLVSAIEQLKLSHSEVGRERYDESNSKFKRDFYGELGDSIDQAIESEEDSEPDR